MDLETKCCKTNDCQVCKPKLLNPNRDFSKEGSDLFDRGARALISVFMGEKCEHFIRSIFRGKDGHKYSVTVTRMGSKSPEEINPEGFLWCSKCDVKSNNKSHDCFGQPTPEGT